MEDYVRIISTQEGDIYHITLSDDTVLFSKEMLCQLKEIRLVGIDLRRLRGSLTTGHDTLAAIEKVIADYFLEHEDVMIFYYCDFINPIPHTKKNLPPQQYRSDLFRLMFERYVRQKEINGVHLSVITVSGIEETFYFHLIYRDRHAMYAPLIGQDIEAGYSK